MIPSDKVVKSILGDDFFDVLSKSEIYKPSTNTAVDLSELEAGMGLVPRSVLSFLAYNLKNMKDGDNLKLKLPFYEDGWILVNKYANDVYSGQIVKDHKIVSNYKYRTIPGIGLILMSAFELYDFNDLEQVKENSNTDQSINVQKLIDERMSLKSLVFQYVNDAVKERENILNMVQEYLDKKLMSIEVSIPKQSPADDEYKPSSLKLKEFIENKKRLGKTEVKCIGCGTELLKSDKYITLCICYGENQDKKIKINKSESGFVLDYPKKFDKENIEMLLQSFKK